jgi:hypothetical protein
MQANIVTVDRCERGFVWKEFATYTFSEAQSPLELATAEIAAMNKKQNNHLLGPSSLVLALSAIFPFQFF